ncbi:hydroxymethylpyrimidine/phosphomethylpyrimidine kinase [Inquilinus sp. CAU 1745]|uniref:bifunctional hydroxymethylpyrimidine kinase/phosphomethylpyrimidine kinase n=1 Tax=Inquilinus sp. CAU 1745 TaxID=3140369 RepID=UPI00325B84B9
MNGRILVIGGSDNTGSAGIQGDLKTATALGGYASSAITCITIQDGGGMRDMVELPADLVGRQIDGVIDGLGVDAVKVGLLTTPEMVDAVVDRLERVPDAPVVVDAATSSRDRRALTDSDTVANLKRRLMVRARILVASVSDAEVLAGAAIRTLDDKRHVADMLRTIGVETVVLTDESGTGDTVVDFIAGPGSGLGEDGERVADYPRPHGRKVRGVSGALATAIATFLARGSDPASAVAHARMYLASAVAHAPELGMEIGPIHHGYAFLFDPLQRG